MDNTELLMTVLEHYDTLGKHAQSALLDTLLDENKKEALLNRLCSDAGLNESQTEQVKSDRTLEAVLLGDNEKGSSMAGLRYFL